jgi:ribosomal protein S18 acetylase RimI-like enzyme
LLQAAADFGRSAGAARLTLSTAHTNTSAQSLYVAEGWRLDEIFRSYQLAL